MALGIGSSAASPLSDPPFAALLLHYQNAAESEARSALAEEAFARAWAEGQAMTLEQAVEYALQGEA